MMKPAAALFFILLLLLLLPSILLPKAASIDDDNNNINISFTGFTPNMHGIVYEADAFASGNAIQLTVNQVKKDLNGSVGRATYYKPMHLWHNSSAGKIILADFTTRFSFAIDSLNNSSGNRGDGFAFFLAPKGSSIPPNSGGGCLGLQSCDADANSKFVEQVAVEFDTYRNVWDPLEMSDHFAIDLSLVKNTLSSVEWSWNDIENGGRVNALVSYNSSTQNLSVLLLDADDSTGRNSSSLNATLDLSQYLPEWVTFGFSGSTGVSIELHTIYSWDFSSTLQVPMSINPPEPARKSKSWATWLLVVLAIVGTISTLIPVLGLVWFFCMRRKYSRMEDRTMFVNSEMEMVTVPRQFSYEELRLATSNFATQGLLGEGGFGKVYLGFLRDIGCNVAVKRTTPNSQQGVKEYRSEIRTITRLRHRNLVQLIGWCHNNKEFLIVYEFLPNKSLYYQLHREPCLLTWDKRYQIAMGVASALFYMQEECDQCVLHRDIKSSNVLLDLSFNAKLGDFGLSRLVDHGQGSQTTRVMLGTDGYIAPECLNTYKASKESDIYSFGIVALEIASGKQAIVVTERNGKKLKTKLVEMIWELRGKASLFDAADPRLYDNYDTEEMERLLLVGLACAHPDSFARPSITQVIDVLCFKAPLLMLPLEMPVPTYVAALQDDIMGPSTSNSSHTSGCSRKQTQNLGSSGSSIHSLKDKNKDSRGSDTESKF